MRKYFKLFQDKNNEIIVVEYSEIDQRNYFKFVKTQFEKGLRQIIITSELMLELLKIFFIDYNFKIIDICFAEEDEELNGEIVKILEKVEKDRGYFVKLLEKLECIADNSSIDIENIELKSTKKIDEKYLTFFIRVNGILSLEDSTKDFLLKIIIKLLEEKL